VQHARERRTREAVRIDGDGARAARRLEALVGRLRPEEVLGLPSNWGSVNDTSVLRAPTDHRTTISNSGTNLCKTTGRARPG
jgi:hypothetical protein